jgi:hypothetical protein
MTAYTTARNELPESPGYVTGDTLTTPDGMSWTYRETSGWISSPVSGGGVVDVSAADVTNDVAPASPGVYPDTLTQYLVPAGGGPAPGFKLVWIAPANVSLPALRGWRYSFAPSETVI